MALPLEKKLELREEIERERSLVQAAADGLGTDPMGDALRRIVLVMRRRRLERSTPGVNVFSSIRDELQELQSAVTPDEQIAEFGDLLHAVLRYGLSQHIPIEVALHTSIQRTVDRLDYIAEHATAEPGTNEYQLQSRVLWDKAKASEE